MQCRSHVVPTQAVRRELEQWLAADESAAGDVYRRTLVGETPNVIRMARAAATPNFVDKYRRMGKSLLTGELPVKPTAARDTARLFRRVLTTGDLLSPEARAAVKANLTELARRADDASAQRAETRAALRSTARAERAMVPGVYVYALPQYLRWPVDQETGRTLLKVGYSGCDTVERFWAQTRITALPERAVLLRIYETMPEQARAVEATFHMLLERAGHVRNAEAGAGTEFFLTDLDYLDAIATALKLPIQMVGGQDAEEPRERNDAA